MFLVYVTQTKKLARALTTVPTVQAKPFGCIIHITQVKMQPKTKYRTVQYYAELRIRIRLNADPDPSFHFIADPDPSFHIIADQDPPFHFHADLDSAPHYNDVYICNH